jgi:hypothetical protein
MSGIGEGAFARYTGTLTTNWCYSEPTENIYVLNSNVAVWCETNEITGEEEWYIYINDTNVQHSWHPPSAEFAAKAYRLVLVSCSPLLLTFGGDAGCTGNNCAWTWEAACFIHGTLISTPHGLVPIESLQVGEAVYDADHEIVKVEAVHYSTREVILFLADDDGIQTGVTPEHPFLSYDGKSFVLAGNLKTGDRLRHGKIVGHVKALVDPTEVVNLTVSGSKTFIANGFAVHNKGE